MYKNKYPAIILLSAAIRLAAIPDAIAADAYVVAGGSAPAGAFTNWATAATNIQNAIDAINPADGNTIYISNGTYMLTNQLVITKDITLRSWNNGLTDRTNTVIHANNHAGKPIPNRCVYMNNPNARLIGLTFTAGWASNAAGDYFDNSGGGIYITNGGMIADCIVAANTSAFHSGGGGGIYITGAGAIVSNCLIANNIGRFGGGLFIGTSGNTALVCEIRHNIAQGNRGGGFFVYGAASLIDRCLVASNRAVTATCAGGGGVIRERGVVRNTLIADNIAQRYGGGLFLWGNPGKIENCTITRNSVTHGDDGGGINGYDAASYAGWLIENSVIYDNTSTGTNHDLHIPTLTNAVFTNCCTTAALDDLRPGINTGNFTNPPRFADTNAFNFRPASGSPCVNSGANRVWMSTATDMDLRPRIQYRGVVDVGAYEMTPPNGTVYTLR